MSDDYPVHIEVTSPVRFDRMQLLLRLAVMVTLGWFGITAGWFVCVLYGLLPVVAAIAISSIGADRFTKDFAPRLWRVLAWLLRVSAYMTLLVDRFPTGETDPVQIEIQLTGTPTVGSALTRLVTSIPSGFVLMLLCCISSLLWIVAAVIVMLGGAMPDALLAYQRDVLRWQARLVAYHAALVDAYPPFSFDTGDHHGTAATASGAR